MPFIAINFDAMRHIHLILAAAILSTAVVLGQSSSVKKEEQAQKHAERVEKRKIRIEQYTRHIDSLVTVRSFTFTPNTFQRQPAGPMRQITNPNFELNIYPDWIDVCLPYITGVVPPYRITVFNYAVPGATITDYMAAQTSEGWEITFSTSLFSANTYKFQLQIATATGSATLDITSEMFNTVSYWGQIIGN